MQGQQTINVDVPADYGSYDYDGKNVQVPQSYYFRDVYQGDDGKWYVKAIAYYNPDYIRTSGEKKNLNSTGYLLIIREPTKTSSLGKVMVINQPSP